ncbi:RING finger domain and kelch repeat-containing protein DDB_G0271372-like [Mytilus trossulus]|uniref:RING finger domain and kelch repeat-containing protein DDB_G0271372-like n=1 Tax=Mytilus trossulus TaxID=6551 RepID=UPI003003DF9A
MASFCEECSDSIGDKHCVDCDRYFCLNCKLTHLSVGKFPTHSFHNVEPVKERGPIENDSQTQRKADTLIKPGVVMADLDIENLPHNYGDSEKNVDNTDWDGKQKDATQISTENKTDTVVKSDTVSTKSESSSNKAEKPKEVTNETFDQASEPVNSKIVPDKPDDKKETNKPSSAQIKPTANTDSIPDVISDTEKDKRIFELTETEKIKEPNKSHEIVTTDKTNEESKNYRSEKTAYSILEVTSMCNDHNEEDFIFICDRCDVPVCKICVVREHKGHKLSDIEETATMRENALAHVLTPRIAGAVRNSSEMSLNLSTFDSEINEVNRAIERHGQSIKELVDRQVELMIKNVKERAGRRKNKYSDVNDTLNDAVVKGKLLQQRHQDLTKSKNDGALILQLKKLSKDATNFHYPSVPNFPTVKYHPPKVTEGDVEALFGAFSFIDMDPRSNRLPKMIPPANIYSTPKHRWQCCRCGTDQLNE